MYEGREPTQPAEHPVPGTATSLLPTEQPLDRECAEPDAGGAAVGGGERPEAPGGD